MMNSSTELTRSDDELTALRRRVAELEARQKRLTAADEAQRESESNYRQLFLADPDAIVIVDSETRQIVDVNPSALALYGYSEEEMRELDALALSAEPQKSWRHIQEVIESKMNGMLPATVSRLHRKKNGTIFPVEISVGHFTRRGRRLICAIMRDVSERLQADRALRESEALFRDMAENIREVFWLFDWDEKRFVYVSPAYAQIWGRPRQGLYDHYKEWVESILPEDRAYARQTFNRILATGGGEMREYRIVRPDGEVRWVSDKGFAVRAADGQVRRIAGIAEDITERKRAEEALRVSESHFRSLMASAHNYVVYRLAVDPEEVLHARVEFVSPSIRNVTGVSEPDVFADWFQNIHPDDKPRVLEAQQLSVQTGARFDETMRIYHPERREWRWVTAVASPVTNAAGTTTHFNGIILDVSERMKTEADLRQSVETLMTVLDSIDADVYVSDMKTHEILFMNRHMQNSFAADLVGKTCYRVFRGESAPCAHCTNDKLLDAAGNPTGVIEWEDRNPVNNKWYANFDRAIRWIDGRIVRLQIATDVSNMKQLEQERLATEQKLRQSHKMEAIGTLAGGIAHDFNNILSAIIGYTELAMSDTPAGSPVHHDLQSVLSAGGRARDLVQQILAFSRQSEIEPKPVNLKFIVKETLKLLRSTLPSSIEIREDVNTDAVVKADPTQIHQVLMNLCANAGHAMRDSGGVLVVTLATVEFASDNAGPHPDLKPGHYAKLRVEDTGKGIEPAFLDRIFDPFFTTKDKSEGTGMGLSVVHGIVKGHEGGITVESTPGEGTVFDVFFPLVEEPVVEKRVPDVAAETGSERILFVDDEFFQADLGEKILSRLGYHVTALTSSSEALELFRAAPDKFDLVITDMTMPKMTGDILAQKLHAVRNDIPILICTGYSDILTADRMKAAGIKGLAMKPIVINDLARLIRKALQS